MAKIAQQCWSSGELSPENIGRVDIEQYFKGATTLKNFIVKNNASICRRQGTDFVANLSDVIESELEEGDDPDGLLIPFMFNGDKGLAIYVVNHKGYLFSADNGLESTIENELPWTNNELKSVRFTQVNDVLILTHWNYPPVKMTATTDGLTGNVVLTAEYMNFGLKAAPTIVNPAGTCGEKTGTAVIINGSTNSTAKSKRDEMTTVTVAYRATSVRNGVESEASNERSVTWGCPWEDGSKISVEVYDGTGNGRPDYYYIYRSINGDFRRIGCLTPGKAAPYSATYVDNYKKETEAGLPVAISDFCDGPGNYPACVAVKDQRLVFACTKNDPQRIVMSCAGDFYGFYTNEPLQDDNAIDVKIAMTRFSKINHLADMRYLVAFGQSDEWLVSAPNGGGLTPTTISLTAQSYLGTSETLPPIVANASILFMDRSNRQVREYTYNLQNDGLAGKNISILSEHLLRDHEVVDWCYQQFPDGLVWMVREDGALLSLSFLPEQGVYSWQQHELGGGGKAVSVCCTQAVMGQNYDDSPRGTYKDTSEVFIVVKRNIGVETFYTLERMRMLPRDGKLAKHSVVGDCVTETTAEMVAAEGMAQKELASITSAALQTNSCIVPQQDEWIDVFPAVEGLPDALATGASLTVQLKLPKITSILYNKNSSITTTAYEYANTQLTDSAYLHSFRFEFGGREYTFADFTHKGDCHPMYNGNPNATIRLLRYGNVQVYFSFAACYETKADNKLDRYTGSHATAKRPHVPIVKLYLKAGTSISVLKVFGEGFFDKEKYLANPGATTTSELCLKLKSTFFSDLWKYYTDDTWRTFVFDFDHVNETLRFEGKTYSLRGMNHGSGASNWEMYGSGLFGFTSGNTGGETYTVCPGDGPGTHATIAHVAGDEVVYTETPNAITQFGGNFIEIMTLLRLTNYPFYESVRFFNPSKQDWRDECPSGLALAAFPIESEFESVYPCARQGDITLNTKRINAVRIMLDKAGPGATVQGHDDTDAEAQDVTDIDATVDDRGNIHLWNGWTGRYLVGRNTKDGRVRVKTSSPWPLSILRLVTDLVFEKEGENDFV